MNAPNSEGEWTPCREWYAVDVLWHWWRWSTLMLLSLSGPLLELVTPFLFSGIPHHKSLPVMQNCDWECQTVVTKDTWRFHWEGMYVLYNVVVVLRDAWGIATCLVGEVIFIVNEPYECCCTCMSVHLLALNKASQLFQSLPCWLYYCNHCNCTCFASDEYCYMLAGWWVD